MKLLDVATVERGVQIRDAYNLPARECGVELRITEFCDTTPEDTALIGTDTSLPGEFKVASFPLQGFLRRGVLCAQPDDQAWFGRAFDQKLEFALTWALVVQHAAGAESWSNGAGTQQTALAGTSDVQLRDAVAIARRQWMKSVMTDDAKGPILHVPPRYAAALKTQGVLESVDKSIYGDRVVIGDGYDEHPNIFYSGAIKIRLGEKIQDHVPVPRINNEINVIDLGVEIVVPPCSIVRAGAYA